MMYAEFGTISSKTDIDYINYHFHSIEHHLNVYERWKLNHEFDEFYTKSTKKIRNEFQKQQLKSVLEEIFLYQKGFIYKLE